jgi:glycerate-2-kinase
MAEAAAAALGGHVRTGVVIAPTPRAVIPPFRLILAEHPEPGPGSLAAGRQALEIARSVPKADRLLVLLSGGASSLMAVPATGITLDEKREATRVLLRAGADIHSLNTVRKHLSAVKGGRLAVATPGECRTLVISDVVGDDLSFIGSGPTVPDESTFADARAVIDQFGGPDEYPETIVAHLEAGIRGERPETPKSGDPRLERSVAAVIGGRFNAMRGVAAEARSRRYQVVVIEEPVTGEAREAGPKLLRRMIAQAQGLPRPVCVIASGETTVTVKGNGRGGRNQELALAVAEGLASAGSAVLASAGTDGVDGPTDAAGALVDSTTMTRADAHGLDIQSFLRNNDSYSFFKTLGDLIRTGPTGTNVDDLQILLLS